MVRVRGCVLIGLVAALAVPGAAAARGLLLFDTCGPTERRSYDHPAFHVVRPDGSGFRTLRDWPIRAGVGCPRAEPSWSPSGRRLVYRHGDAIATADRRLRRRRIVHPARGLWPAWSPNGARIAFTRLDDGGRDDALVTVPAGGGRPRVVATVASRVLLPRWRPDSRVLIFHTGPPTAPRLLEVSARGGRLRDLGRGTAPAYAPNGERIAFADSGALWTMRSDGTRRRRLTTGAPGVVIERITWSPDGRRIAFLEDEPGDSIATFIRIIPRRGGRVRTITLPDGLCCPNNLSWSTRSAR